MQEELLLLHRARALETEALAEIHDRYYTAIYRYISFRINDPFVVEDLTSEVFLRLLHALRDRSAPQNTLKGWLYGVASNVVKEQYRRNKRVAFIPLHESIPANGKSPEQMVEAQLLRENLQAVLQELTEEQQQVLALRFGFEMSICEAAATMGKSEAAVKMLQARAIAALSRRMVVEAVMA